MKIFDIVERRVVINENVLLIPEFKRIVSKYKEHALDVFCFIYYYCDFKSPFVGYEESRKIDTLMKLYNTHNSFSMEDPHIVEAIKRYKELSWSPKMELLDALKSAVYKMATYMKNANYSDENITQIRQTLKDIGPTIASYDILKDAVEKEVEAGVVRGGKSVSNRER